jgi:hypothetical protein
MRAMPKGSDNPTRFAKKSRSGVTAGRECNCNPGRLSLRAPDTCFAGLLLSTYSATTPTSSHSAIDRSTNSPCSTWPSRLTRYRDEPGAGLQLQAGRPRVPVHRSLRLAPSQRGAEMK